MSTVAQKEGTPASLIDDIANTLTSFGEWSSGDSGVSNTQNDNMWHNNGRVLEHSGTGTYLLMYVNNGEVTTGAGDGAVGVRCVHSSDWDSQASVPAGDTTVISDDPFSDNVTNLRGDSFTNTNTVAFSAGEGIYTHSTALVDRVTAAQTDITYFLSGNGEYLNVGAWNTTDGSNGISGWLTWEHVNDKFWNDSVVPVAIASSDSHQAASSQVNIVTLYGFAGFLQSDGGQSGQVGHDFDSCIGLSEWGFINPASADDTFFFRRSPIYQATSQSTPVAFVDNTIPNDPEEGGAHGDTISHNGTDYQVFRQSGASESYPVSVAMRYE